MNMQKMKKKVKDHFDRNRETYELVGAVVCVCMSAGAMGFAIGYDFGGEVVAKGICDALRTCAEMATTAS